jgi:bacterioferritin-associated ferredoxin
VFVCQCAAVTERDIADAVAAGADTVGEVSIETGAGAGCGTCHESIEAILLACGGCPRLSLVVA